MADLHQMREFPALWRALIRLIETREGISPGAAAARLDWLRAQPWGNAALSQMLFDRWKSAATPEQARQYREEYDLFRKLVAVTFDRRGARHRRSATRRRALA